MEIPGPLLEQFDPVSQSPLPGPCETFRESRRTTSALSCAGPFRYLYFACFITIISVPGRIPHRCYKKLKQSAGYPPDKGSYGILANRSL